MYVVNLIMYDYIIVNLVTGRDFVITVYIHLGVNLVMEELSVSVVRYGVYVPSMEVVDYVNTNVFQPIVLSVHNVPMVVGQRDVNSVMK